MSRPRRPARRLPVPLLVFAVFTVLMFADRLQAFLSLCVLVDRSVCVPAFAADPGAGFLYWHRRVRCFVMCACVLKLRKQSMCGVV
ncbi:hypothetical protein EDC01DRAFT_670727, partial [Geopyxis carbonaria]